VVVGGGTGVAFGVSDEGSSTSNFLRILWMAGRSTGNSSSRYATALTILTRGREDLIGEILGEKEEKFTVLLLSLAFLSLSLSLLFIGDWLP
jgi:hypothetical protein